jgi:hypothetical protein
MGRLIFATLMLAIATAVSPAIAADTKVTVTTPPPAASTVVVAPAPPVVVDGAPVIVTRPPARVQYGCKRVWRCDQQVCEWRRGCWGVYGYMEGPYYSQELAQRQWERDGWPISGARAQGRGSVNLSVAK